MKLLLYPLVLILLLAGCSKNESEGENNKNNTSTVLVNTKWKCVGFVEGDNPLELIEPNEISGNYVKEYLRKIYNIAFEKEGLFKGFATSHDLKGVYVTDGNSISLRISTSWEKSLEILDGERFISALLQCFKYELVQKQLKLYYGDNQYLLFNLVE